MKTEDDEIRAEFERWYLGSEYSLGKEVGCFGKTPWNSYVYTSVENKWQAWQACQQLNDAVIAEKDERYNSLDTVFEALKDTHDKLLDIARQQDAEIARLREALNKVNELTKYINDACGAFSDKEQHTVGSIFIQLRQIIKALEATNE